MTEHPRQFEVRRAVILINCRSRGHGREWLGRVELGALVRAGLKGGDAVGPYRVTGELGRWPEHRLYRAVHAGQDKPFLLRELVPLEDELRARKRLALEAERFALAKTALRRPSPYRLSFVDYIEDRYAVFAHRNLDWLSGNAAGAEVGDEKELRRLVAPVVAVLHELHRNDLVCCGIRPEEILIDPEDATVPIFAGLQHVYHLHGMGPQRPGRDDAGVFAPEFTERQRPLSVAADVYALATLMFSLIGAGPDSCFGDEEAIEAALKKADPGRCSDQLRAALILGLKFDPAERPQSIGRFEELAFGPREKGTDRSLAQKRTAPAPWLARPEQDLEASEAQPQVETEAEALPPWPPIRAYLDAHKAGEVVRAGASQGEGSQEPSGAQESEIAVAARGLAVALSECVLAPARLVRTTAGDAAKLVFKTPRAVARTSGHMRLAVSGELRTPTIAAALVGVALLSLWSGGASRPSSSAASAAVVAAAVPNDVALVASTDDLVRLPERREEAAVTDDLIGREAARALKPQMLAVEAKPVMVALPSARPVDTLAPAISAPGTAAEEDQSAVSEPRIDPAIAVVQAELQRLGLYRGAIDGLMGPRTLAGIRAVAGALRQDLNSDAADQLTTAIQSMTPVQLELARALIIRPKKGLIEAHAITQPLPNFPSDAFSRRIEGWIEVSFDVDPQGEIEHAKVTAFNNGRALEAFSSEALNAIGQAIYAPARKNGKPVWSRGLKVRYRFDVIHRGWGPFKSREPHSSIVADSSPPAAVPMLR